MKQNPSKKVVIINDIHSDTIEQAIFILRAAGGAESGISRSGIHMVQEAQRIINAYEKTVDAAQRGIRRKNTDGKRCGHRGELLRRGAYVLLAVLAFAGAAVFIRHSLGAVLSGF